MKRNRYSVFFIFIFLSITRVYSQSQYDVRINEILVINDSNITDEYGCREPWIELFNSAYNTVNIGGCYITNDLSNPTKFRIPKNSYISKIPTRGYLILWGDNKPFRGINHLNFSLKDSYFLALIDVDGKTIIDSVSFYYQKPGISYSRKTDGENQWIYVKEPTPGKTNNDYNVKTSADKIQNMDPWGVGITFIAMSIVFFILLMLYLSFKNFTRYFLKYFNKVKLHSESDELETSEKKLLKIMRSEEDEVVAAISTVIHLYFNEIHDYEPTQLTIKRISRPYSPWSSKIYGLRNVPQRNFKR